MPLRYLSLFLVFLTALGCSAKGPVTFFPNAVNGVGGLARVVVPAPITVLSIDGTDVKAPSKETGTYELHMEPGHHLIAFKYKLWWGTTISGYMVESKTVGVDAQFEDGKVYELTYKELRDEIEASNYRSNFKATLIEPTSGLKVESYPVGDLGRMLAAKNISRTTSATPAEDRVKQLKYWWHLADENERKEFTGWMKTATETYSTPSSAESAVKADTVKQLKYWWLGANEKERQEFTDWMKSSTETGSPDQAKKSDKNTGNEDKK